MLKVDTWFSIDRFTGSKKGSLSFGGCFEGGDDNTCPKADPSSFLIGRTEYNMYGIIYLTQTHFMIIGPICPCFNWQIIFSLYLSLVLRVKGSWGYTEKIGPVIWSKCQTKCINKLFPYSMMYDSRAEGRKWNISFYDYSSNLGGVEINPEYSKFTAQRLIPSTHEHRVAGSHLVFVLIKEGNYQRDWIFKLLSICLVNNLDTHQNFRNVCFILSKDL